MRVTHKENKEDEWVLRDRLKSIIKKSFFFFETLDIQSRVDAIDSFLLVN